jgi:hypothetical protein
MLRSGLNRSRSGLLTGSRHMHHEKYTITRNYEAPNGIRTRAATLKGWTKSDLPKREITDQQRYSLTKTIARKGLGHTAGICGVCCSQGVDADQPARSCNADSDADNSCGGISKDESAAWAASLMSHGNSDYFRRFVEQVGGPTQQFCNRALADNS